MLCQSLPAATATATTKDQQTYNKPRFSSKKDTSKRHTIASYSDHDFHGIFKESGLPFIQQNHKKSSMLSHIASVPEHLHQPRADSAVNWYLNQPLNSFLPEFIQVTMNEGNGKDHERCSAKDQLLLHWKTIESYYVKRLDSLQKEIDNATVQNEKLFIAKEELVQTVLQLHTKSMELSAKNESLLRSIAERERENNIHAFVNRGNGNNNSNQIHSGFVRGVTLEDPPYSHQQTNPPFSPHAQQQASLPNLLQSPAISISEPLSLSSPTDLTNRPVKKEASPGLFRQISLRLSTRRKKSVLQQDTSSNNDSQNNIMSNNYIQPNHSSTIHSGASSSILYKPLSSDHSSNIHQQQRKESMHIKSAEQQQQQQQLLHPAAVLSTSPPLSQHQQVNSHSSYFQQKQQSPQPQDPAITTATATNSRYKSIFGNDLVEQAKSENSLVPHIVSHCIKEVECRGLDVEGIYRKSGTYAQVKELQKEFSQENPQLSKYDDVNVITSLLKLYFRELTTPLIPSHFILPSSLKDQERLNKTYALLHQLPLEIYSTIKHLVQHLKRVHQNEAKNRMNSKNLAVVFGPTLMKCSNGDQQMHDIINTVDFIIQQSHILFADY